YSRHRDEYQGRKARPVSGSPGNDDPADASQRAFARLRDRATDPPNLRRSPEHRGRHALPRLAAPAARRLGRSRVGHFGAQPESAELSNHRRGTKTVAAGGFEL